MYLQVKHPSFDLFLSLFACQLVVRKSVVRMRLGSYGFHMNCILLNFFGVKS